MKKWVLGALAASSFVLPGAVQAQSLIGDEVTCEVTGTNTLFCNQGSATVGNDREFVIETSVGNVFGINFTNDQLRINSIGTTAIGGNLFLNFINRTDRFTSATLLENTGFTGFTASDVDLLGQGRLRIDLGNTSATSNGLLRLALTTASAVPEPSTWGMLLIGFGAVGYSIRRAPGRRIPAIV